jgi:HPt (histidine-containing phosphotransfer) domain-containing protein
MEREAVNVNAAKEHLANTYKLTPDKIDHMLNGLKGPLIQEFTNADEALEQNNLADLSRAAHTIKGCLLNLGVADWAELAREIELSAKKEEQEDYAAMFKELRTGLGPLLE